MVTYSDTTLTDSEGQVNSGNAVYLNCTGIQYSMNTYLSAPQFPAKSIDKTHSQLLAPAQYLGFENPRIEVRGVIDLKSSSSNVITLKLLQQFAKSGNDLILTDYYDLDTSTFRISSLSGTFPNETITTIKCQVESFSVETNPRDSKEGHILRYTLILREVQ